MTILQVEPPWSEPSGSEHSHTREFARPGEVSAPLLAALLLASLPRSFKARAPHHASAELAGAPHPAVHLLRLGFPVVLSQHPGCYLWGFPGVPQLGAAQFPYQRVPDLGGSTCIVISQ